MQELLTFIQKHKDEALVEINDVNDCFNFFDDFFCEYKNINLDMLLTVDRAKLLTILIMREHQNLDVNMIYNFMCKYKEVLYKMTTRDLEKISKCIDLALAGDILSKLFSFFESAMLNESFDIFKFYLNNDIDLASLAINASINEIKKDKEARENECAMFEQLTGRNIKNKKRDKLTSEYLRKAWNIDALLEPLYQARKWYVSVINDAKNKEKNRNKLKNSYNELLENLSKAFSSGEPIKYTDDFFGTIEDSEFRAIVLKEIYLYNKRIYGEVECNYNLMIANSSLNYKALLAKYGIILDESRLNSVISNNISDLEEMLKYLRSKGIDSPDILLRIIQTSDLETIKKYISLMDLGIISKELLLNNLDLFNKELPIYKNFVNILNMFDERKINPYFFRDCQQIYLIEINTLIHNIDILKAYNLYDCLKVGSFYTFFDDNDLNLSIDTLLELGFEKYLESDLTLLNYSNKFNRLKLLKLLNMPISSKEELVNVLTDDKFFVPDSMIDDYISDTDEIYHYFGDYISSDNFSLGENCDETLRTYIIGGGIISKNKIFRILSIKSDAVLNDSGLSCEITGDTISPDKIMRKEISKKQ